MGDNYFNVILKDVALNYIKRLDRYDICENLPYDYSTLLLRSIGYITIDEDDFTGPQDGTGAEAGLGRELIVEAQDITVTDADDVAYACLSSSSGYFCVGVPLDSVETVIVGDVVQIGEWKILYEVMA